MRVVVQHPEAAFSAQPGILRTRVGYCAGESPSPASNPSYKSVCNDPKYNDYAETIQLDYDPSMLSYSDILDAFFRLHDARSAGRKRQYASIIFTHDDNQYQCAMEALDTTRYPARAGVSTLVEKASDFWDAEPYHQKWLLQRKRPLMLALGLTDVAQLLERPAAVLNAYAAGRLSAEKTMERLEELLHSGEISASTYHKVQDAIFA